MSEDEMTGKEGAEPVETINVAGWPTETIIPLMMKVRYSADDGQCCGRWKQAYDALEADSSATIARLTAELEIARAQIGAVLQEAADLRDGLADMIGARPMSSIHSALCEYSKAILALNPEAIAANAKRREPSE